MRSMMNQPSKTSKRFSKLEYEKISQEPNRLSPKPILPPPLLILDLNGSLIYRPKFKDGEKRPDPIIRPNLSEFFNYIFGKELMGLNEYPNWEVMIWSSAQGKNVGIMCDLLGIQKREKRFERFQSQSPQHRYSTRSKGLLDKLESLELQANDEPSKTLPKLVDPMNNQNLKRKRSVLDIWDRSQMNLKPKDFDRKVSTTKDLNSIWKSIKYFDPYTQKEYSYGPKNTIIIDDSPEKLSLQPYNLCQIKEFNGDLNDDSLLEIIKTLKEIKPQSNFSSYLKSKSDQNQSQSQSQTNPEDQISKEVSE